LNIFLASTGNRNGGGINTDVGINSLLRERELITNLAFKKRATQSDQYYRNNNASIGVDGHRDQCTLTKKSRNPWWQVSLIDVYEIWAVVILKCCKYKSIFIECQ